MKYFLFVCAWISCIQAIQAQEYYHQSYDWEAEPQRLTLTESEASASAVVLLDREIIEFTSIEEEIAQFETKHSIIRANDEQAVNAHNKVFIPMREGTEIVKLQARAISPDGKITELDKKNIRELSNYEEYGNFKIFAIEGAEKGADLEYFYTILKNPDFIGRRIVQEEIPIRQASVQLISSRKLEFAIKSYNGLSEFELKKDEEAFIWESTTENIPAQREELYSAELANFMKYAYKLAYITKPFGKSQEFYTWTMAAENIYNNYFPTERSKTMEKLLKKQKLSKLAGEQAIRAIEQYFKTQIIFNSEVGISNVEDILDKKYADESGMTILMIEAFKQMSIPFKLVVTSNRYRSRFDKDFEDYTNLDEFLFYFPKYDKYITPGRPDLRFGYAPEHLGENYGLFITESEYAGVSAKVDFIPLAPPSACTSRNDINLSFDEKMEYIVVDRVNKLTGYRAHLYRAAFEYGDDASKEQMVDFLVKSGAEEAEVQEAELSNELIKDGTENKPLVITSKIKTEALLENAGDSYLLNIGMVIGLQSELYQEHKRINEIEMDYPMIYNHYISFEIPEGYTVVGIEDATIEKFYRNGDDIQAQFVSKVMQEGNMIKIEIEEFYTNVRFDKERYEEFRQVINAAADFNKVVFVLEEG